MGFRPFQRSSRVVVGLSLVVCSLTLAAACSSDDDAPKEPALSPGELPPAKAESTLDRTLRLSGPVGNLKTNKLTNPSLPEGIAQADTALGDLIEGPGEPMQTRVAGGGAAPAPGPNAKRLVRFVHLADLQIPDDESPTRAGFVDTDGATSSALRPQDPDLCRMTNAAVRAINAHHANDPIDFVLLGGDNADSAQKNEVSWVLSLFRGGESLECDSGEDDDLIPGPFNDGKDPFVPEGLKMPWKWVTGNHDVLVQGNLGAISNREKSLGTNAPLGTRDWKQDGAIVRETIADAERVTLDRTELMTTIAADGDGHGIGEAQKTSGKAFHHFDVPNTPLRFLVLDTAHAEGGADGVLTQRDVDAFVTPVLEEAKAQGKVVIIASHHASGSLTEEGGTFGSKEPDALLSEAWRAYLAPYPVLFSMVGHSHQHQVKELAAGERTYWEVMTSAIADFPNEFRVVEIWDQDNGWLSLRSTCVDLPTEGDPIVARARRLAATDVTTGWLPHDGLGEANERNVELWIQKP
jgi:hypothetical protein